MFQTVGIEFDTNQQRDTKRLKKKKCKYLSIKLLYVLTMSILKNIMQIRTV